MKHILLVVVLTGTVLSASAQTRKMVAIGSSTTEGLNATPAIDSSWVRRFNYYYKYQLGVLDSTYNLGVSGTTQYNGMPSSYIPPAGRPSPDVTKNVTRAHTLMSDLAMPANGVVIINYPTNGYDVYTIAEIMTTLQIMYDSVTVTGKKCYITTTQPRTDGVFAPSAIKLKLAIIKDSILNRFGPWAINFYDGMYDPADSSIAAPYRSFDLTHFNNAGHRELFNRVVAKNVFNLAALPLAWGPFVALANRQQQVVLNWSMLQGSNVKDFVVEHSTNGQQYATVARISAKGNSTGSNGYTFTHTTPSLNGNNYYRLQEVDADGKITLSPVRTVRFNNGKPFDVQLTPNPVQQVLYANIQAEGIRVDVVQHGRQLRSMQLAPGQHAVFVGDLPAGMYQLIIYRQSKRIDSRQMIKL